ncbi:M28 family peptidase, partial [Romeria aff. gracilis LEGE 07310]
MSHSELQKTLYGHLCQLTRERDPFIATEGHFYTQQYLQSQFEQWGAVESQDFTVRGKIYSNWSLSLPGQTRLAPILVGAHYDTVVGSPGADDNASGLAVLLALASTLAQSPPRRPVIFVAFDLEEYGLEGSRAWVARRTQTGQPLHLMLSLEMLGYFSDAPRSQRYPAKPLEWVYPTRGNFIGLIGNWPTILTMQRLKRHIKQAGTPCQWLPMVGQGNLLPATRRSDHAPFWDAGYPAILVTDTADLRNPHYHQASDRIETLNLAAMAGVCAGLAEG